MDNRKISIAPEKNTQSIEDYGLIGDMRTCALVGQDGSIDFMCWPNFDSPSIFCRILDTTNGGGGHWSCKPTIPAICKQNYLASSNTLQTRWIHETGVICLTDFFAIRKDSKEKIKTPRGPVLIRRLECMRGHMTVEVEVSPRPNYALGELFVTDIKTGPGHSQQISWSKPSIKEAHNVVVADLPTPSISVVCLEGDSELSEISAKMFEAVGEDADSKPDRIRATFRLTEGQQVIMNMSTPGETDLETMAEISFRRETDVHKYWRNWIRKCVYRGRFQQEVERSLLTLKLLTYKPTGAIVAAPTFSLPENIGGSRNWDYRYSWVRDSSFTIYVFLKMGFAEEAEAFIYFIFDRIAEWQEKSRVEGTTKHLPLMFSIHGETSLPEEELDHLGGYLDSKPVRVGNAATEHIQLDIYGELMDAIYLFNKHGKPVSYDQWVSIRHLIDFVCEVWTVTDMSIWEVRGQKENFVYSKIMLWVAIDRGLRLADKRCLPCPHRMEWLQTRDAIYEQVMEKGYNKELGSFVQSYESNTTLDAAVLIAPLVFFMPPNDPRFLSTLDQILKSPEKGGLTSAGLVFRYNHEKTNDGVGGREGTFVMCTMWLIEALIRAAKYDVKYLDKALSMFETVTSFSNHLGMFSEEIAISGEQLGNTPQAFSHLAFVSAAFNLERVMGGGHNAKGIE